MKTLVRLSPQKITIAKEEKPIKISAIVLTKNEEEQIGGCLNSVNWVDEIIVVDSGSSDRTVEIAKDYTDKILFEKSDDFSSKRNLGQDMAKGEWILYLDADERVTPELWKEISEVIEKDWPASYFIPRKNFYFGENEWPYIEKIERLFKKNQLEGWKGKIHESPVIRGQTGELKNYLLHYTHRDLSSMVKKTIEWSKIEAELRFEAGHPPVVWWRFLRVMMTEFYRSYIKQRGWKAGAVGMIESLYQAFSIFITYARLWEMQKAKNQE